MDTVKAKVTALAKEWTEHCHRMWYSSNLFDYLNHPAYRQLAALDQNALPHIMELYQADDLPWEFVLQTITGIHFMDDPNAYNPAEIKSRWLAWWAEQAQNGTATALGRRSAPIA